MAHSPLIIPQAGAGDRLIGAQAQESRGFAASGEDFSRVLAEQKSPPPTGATARSPASGKGNGLPDDGKALPPEVVDKRPAPQAETSVAAGDGAADQPDAAADAATAAILPAVGPDGVPVAVGEPGLLSAAVAEANRSSELSAAVARGADPRSAQSLALAAVPPKTGVGGAEVAASPAGASLPTLDGIQLRPGQSLSGAAGAVTAPGSEAAAGIASQLTAAGAEGAPVARAVLAAEAAAPSRSAGASLPVAGGEALAAADDGIALPPVPEVQRNSSGSPPLRAAPAVAQGAGSAAAMTAAELAAGADEGLPVTARVEQFAAGQAPLQEALARAAGDDAGSAAPARAADGAPGPVTGAAAGVTAGLNGDAAATAARAAPTLTLAHPPSAPEFAQEFTGHMRLLMKNGVREASLQLHPAELGRLQVTVSTDGDQARILIVADSPQARDAIEQSLPRLREMLEQSGLQLAQGDVAHDRDSAAAGEYAENAAGGSQAGMEAGVDGATAVAVSVSDRLLDTYV